MKDWPCSNILNSGDSLSQPRLSIESGSRIQKINDRTFPNYSLFIVDIDAIKYRNNLQPQKEKTKDHNFTLDFAHQFTKKEQTSFKIGSENAKTSFHIKTDIYSRKSKPTSSSWKILPKGRKF
jgi:hypothetical protein